MSERHGKQIRFRPDLTIPEHRIINDYFESLPHDGRGARKGREIEIALYRYVMEKKGYRPDGGIPASGPPPQEVSPAPAQPAPAERPAGAASAPATEGREAEGDSDEQRTSADSLANSIADSVGS